MTRRPKPGKCVHCLKDGERNWDHVFPRAWYPDTTAPNSERWKMPTCVDCNSAYGRLEEDFLRRVALCLDPDDPASRSVVQGVMRGLQPGLAKSSRDAGARAAAKQRLLADLMEGEDIPCEATYPGVGERWERPIEEQVAIQVPVEYVQRMVEKIVRGIFYVEDEKLIARPFIIEHIPIHEEPAQILRDALDRHGKTHARPPGIMIRRAVVVEDGVSSIFEIVLWGQFKAYATVTSAR